MDTVQPHSAARAEVSRECKRIRRRDPFGNFCLKHVEELFTCRGKHLPTYTPSMDMGGYVVVINAEQVLILLVKLQ